LPHLKKRKKISKGQAFAAKHCKRLVKEQEDKKKADRMRQENEEKGFKKRRLKRKEIKREKEEKR
jgi:hypothetical protein